MPETCTQARLPRHAMPTCDRHFGVGDGRLVKGAPQGRSLARQGEDRSEAIHGEDVA